MAGEKQAELPGELVCKCHSKHVGKFAEQDRRFDNMQKLFYIALAIVIGGMGWLAKQNNEMGKSMARIEAIQEVMIQTDRQMHGEIRAIGDKLERHVVEWGKKNNKEH